MIIVVTIITSLFNKIRQQIQLRLYIMYQISLSTHLSKFVNLINLKSNISRKRKWHIFWIRMRGHDDQGRNFTRHFNSLFQK